MQPITTPSSIQLRDRTSLGYMLKIIKNFYTDLITSMEKALVKPGS